MSSGEAGDSVVKRCRKKTGSEKAGDRLTYTKSSPHLGRVGRS